MNVPVLKTEGLFEISLPKYETFAGFGISLGKLNNEVTGFRGFIYSFQVYDYLINDIGSLYSTSDCDSYCVVVNTDETDFPLCFPDKTCPDFSLIYPSSVSEFPGLNFCDEACNEACQDMTPEGCTACPDPSLEVCDCEVNYQKKYRGIHNGCTACDARKCFECDDENEVCLVCRNPNASPSGADCICKDGFYEKDDSCYFECGKDCLNCEDGQKNYCHDCRDPNAQASDGVCSCSGPYLATNAASEALKCVNRKI